MRQTTIKLGEGARAGAVEVTIKLSDTSNGPELSIVGDVWLPSRRDIIAGGQLGRGILEYLSIPAPGVTPEVLDRLFEVWERWHLNGLRAECSHQRERGETWTTHPCAKCPDCGYKLGSQWLFEPLPLGVLTTVDRWISTGKLD